MTKPAIDEIGKRAIQIAEAVLDIVKIVARFSPRLRIAILVFAESGLIERADR